MSSLREGTVGKDHDLTLTRRVLLQIGGSGLLGLSLPQLLAHTAKAAQGRSQVRGYGKAKSVILIFLQGGPPQQELWDPKPDAPDTIRGPFGSLATNVPGLRLGKHQPLLAKCAHLFGLVRTVHYAPTGFFVHGSAHYYTLTGFPPEQAAANGNAGAPRPTDHPNIGCHIARLKPPGVGIPACVMLPKPLRDESRLHKGGTAGYLGKAHDPFFFFQDPNDTLRPEEFQLPSYLSVERFHGRVELRAQLDRARRLFESAPGPQSLDVAYHKAFDLLLSGRVREALDLEREKRELRDRYGRHTFGQSLLLARRLIEAGTRFVQVNWPSGPPGLDSWDCHRDLSKVVRDLHGPKLDRALSTLCIDLHERGLLSETLVVALGEFGRSPRMGISTSGNSNSPDGRDHWPHCYAVLLAGGGISGGMTYGKSDRCGAAPQENPVCLIELVATIYHVVGIAPATEVLNHLQQPKPLIDARPVYDLLR
jgi:hypothetical protein